MEALHHPNVVGLLDCFASPLPRLVMPYGGKTLGELAAAQAVAPNQHPAIMYQILCGVNYLHSCDVVHGDLNPQTILRSEDGTIRICGLGSATVDRLGFRPLMALKDIPAEGLPIGTLPFRAPEVLMGHLRVNGKMDMWSIGCVFSEIVTGTRLWTAVTPSGLVEEHFEVIGRPCASALQELSACFLWSEFLAFSPPQPAFGDHYEQSMGAGGRDFMRSLLTLAPSRLAKVGMQALPR